MFKNRIGVMKMRMFHVRTYVKVDADLPVPILAVVELTVIMKFHRRPTANELELVAAVIIPEGTPIASEVNEIPYDPGLFD